ncbi:MAG: phosphomannomutase CpsG [Mariprofundaceae bacterium]|nr:phosphomannomutase CpsG [Mariprofundaceae bacterium]
MLNCFKAYDVRGRVPDELNADIAYRMGWSFATYLKAKKVVVGYDVRLSSPSLAQAIMRGLNDAGCRVYDIGEGGTEEVYFATDHYGMDGGIMVTASHNPMDYNGMKFVREKSKPISGDTGLFDIADMVEHATVTTEQGIQSIEPLDIASAYTQHLFSYIELSTLKPLKIVVNAGNGGAGKVIDLLESALPFNFIKVHHQPDGNFPHGIPNPLLPENRSATSQAVLEHQADLGIAWDGDFDRCFFFDELGNFIEGYYIVGLLAQYFLKQQSGQKIIHDPRLTWNTQHIVKEYDGEAIESKTGHAFIKERMRTENAVYGGEMSAHHYFRDFAYCDTGMVPWLLVTALLSQSEQSLHTMVADRIAAFPASGEINRKVENTRMSIEKVHQHYQQYAQKTEWVDGLSMSFSDWRFNLRASNTEALLRLNVESRQNIALMEEKTKEILMLIDDVRAV